jgi:hypothetical protein
MSQITEKFIADGSITNNKVSSGIDASKIGDGSVSNTEFQRLNGLTGDIQTQLDAKADQTIQIATGTNSGLVGGGNLTTNRNLLVDPSNAQTVTAESGDFILIADVSDSNNLKRVTAQSIANLAGGSFTFQREQFTLTLTDITNQKVTLSHLPLFVIDVKVKGGPVLLHSEAWTVTGSDINFVGAIASGGPAALIEFDILEVVYVY